jgi:hypothetical protein
MAAASAYGSASMVGRAAGKQKVRKAYFLYDAAAVPVAA